MIYDEIIAQLKSIVQANTSVKAVYDFIPKTMEKYPSVAITPLSHSDAYQNLRDTRRTYTVMLYVFSNVTDEKFEQGQKQVRDIVDSLVSTIESDVTLGGKVDFVVSTSSSLKFQTKESPLYVGEITIVANKLISRF